MGNVISSFSVLLRILSNFISLKLWASLKEREWGGSWFMSYFAIRNLKINPSALPSFRGELLNSISKENKEKPKTVFFLVHFKKTNPG